MSDIGNLIPQLEGEKLKGMRLWEQLIMRGMDYFLLIALVVIRKRKASRTLDPSIVSLDTIIRLNNRFRTKAEGLGYDNNSVFGSFNPERGTLRAYLSQTIWNETCATADKLLDEQTEFQTNCEEAITFVDEKTPDPLNRVIERERAVMVQEAVNQLPPTLRKTVILRHFQNATLEQIAEEMNTNTKAVRFRLNLAKEILRKKLAHLNEQVAAHED